MAVLLTLAGRAGQVVSREQLLDEVWPDSVVTDDALARCIYQLRHELPPLLEPDDDQPVIETLRKRGFRLVLPVTTGQPGQTQQPGHRFAWSKWMVAMAMLLAAVAGGLWLMRPSPIESQLPVRSIAVLPFANMTGDPQYEHLADGFSEQLSHALANIPDLRVAARTSAFYFKNRQAEIPTIAEQLDVETLLEGSVRRNGELARVTVQLVRDDGFHIWSREYDRPLTDVLQLQSEVAGEVLHELGLGDQAGTALTAIKHDTDYRAYDLYLRGRLALQQRTSEAYTQAISLFQQALAVDQDYALPYTGLADTYSLQLSRGLVTAEQITPQVDAAISRALQLDAQLAEAHASRGLQLFTLNEFSEAEPHLRRAVALNSNYVNAHVWLGLDLVMQDRVSEAIDAYLQAQQLDPLDPSLNRNLGGNLMLAGRPDEGFTYLQRARQITPDDPLAYEMLAGWAVIYGRVPEAIEWSSRGLERFPDNVRLLTHLGSAYSMLGEWPDARIAFDQARQVNADDQILLEQQFYLYLATQDLSAMDALLAQLGGDNPPFGQHPPFGKRRIVLRWLLIRQLLDGNPARAVELADTLDVSDVLTCGAFGEPGPRLYLARALQLTGDQQRADTLLNDCIDDVNRLRARGGTYPRSLYRMAVTLALAGESGQAAELLQSAIASGWRAYHQALHDPLWSGLKDQPPYRAIFAGVAEELPIPD